MKKRMTLHLSALACSAIFVLACSSDVNTPDVGPDPDTLLVTAEILINSGSVYAPTLQVDLVVSVDEADSVYVFNVNSDVPTTGIWYEMPGDTLKIPTWDLGADEGLRTVVARFRRAGFADSDTVSSQIILDTTAPHILPSLEFPGNSSTGLPTSVALSWAPAGDAWCPVEDLTYTVYLDNTEPPTEVYWTGQQTQVFLENLTPSTTLFWRVAVTDLAGNTEPGISNQFSTGNLDLPDFTLAPAGSFLMGSPPDEPGRWSSEEQHHVTLTQPYFIGQTNVTVAQFLGLLNWAIDEGLVIVDADGAYDNVGPNRELIVSLTGWSIFIPGSGGYLEARVEGSGFARMMSWYGAAAYCDWLNVIAGFGTLYDRNDDWNCNGGELYSARGFRLPAEAEWEYACRAGSTTAFANGAVTGSDCADYVLDEIGWYCGNHIAFDYTPAAKIPNAWGIYDMHGGHSDWCYDKWVPYSADSVVNPVNDISGSGRVARGSRGAFPNWNTYCRSAARDWWNADDYTETFSLRLVLGYGR